MRNNEDFDRFMKQAKVIYCKDCWCKDIGPVCKCMWYNQDRPYFCGNCNGHVKGIAAEKVEPIIKEMKRLKAVPEGMAAYSWK